MTNIERLEMETKGITLSPTELQVYLAENGLVDSENYNPASNTNKRNILKTALSILESIANQPQLMKSYKQDDITVSQFHENLMARIDQLERKIREIPNDEKIYEDGASFFYMFSN